MKLKAFTDKKLFTKGQNFRLVQIKSICRGQDKFDLKTEIPLEMSRKHCVKRRKCRGFSPFPAGPNFGPIPNPKKYTCFTNSAIFFFPIAHYKKEMATDILFHPFIPIQQINSPRIPYILVIYFVCKHV